jgi:hypothetical protein
MFALLFALGRHPRGFQDFHQYRYRDSKLGQRPSLQASHCSR